MEDSGTGRFDTSARTTASVRDSIVAAGFDLLLVHGPDGVTAEAAAARAGVPVAMADLLLGGLPGLLTAITARAFDLFSEAMIARRDAAGPDPFQRLSAICRGYLDFAEENARCFQMMFLRGDIDRCDIELMEASARAFLVLRNGCLPFAADGAPDPTLETGVWSLTHGYAALGFADPVLRTIRAEADQGFDTLLAALLAGRAATRDPNALASDDKLQ